MRFRIATVIYGTCINLRPSSPLKCKRRRQILLAETAIMRYKTGDGKKILGGTLILVFPTSVELCQNKIIRCWIMQLHFTTLAEVRGAFAPLYKWQTNHTLSDLPHILLQKEPFTEILRVTSSLCGGPESRKPDIAEVWEHCNFILLSTQWNIEPLVSWNRRSIKMKVLTGKSMCSFY